MNRGSLSFLFGAITAAVLCVGCQPNPLSGGKPLSEWVARLDDVDGDTVTEALLAIMKIPPHQASRARGALSRLATGPERGGFTKAKAGALLFAIDPEAKNLPLREMVVYVVHSGWNPGDAETALCSTAADAIAANANSEILDFLAQEVIETRNPNTIAVMALLSACDKSPAPASRAAERIARSFPGNDPMAAMYRDIASDLAAKY